MDGNDTFTGHLGFQQRENFSTFVFRRSLYLKSVFTGRRDFSPLPVYFLHYITNVFPVQRGRFGDYTTIRVECVQHAALLIGNHEPLARLCHLGRNCLVYLTDLWRYVVGKVSRQGGTNFLRGDNTALELRGQRVVKVCLQPHRIKNYGNRQYAFRNFLYDSADCLINRLDAFVGSSNYVCL